MKFLVLFVALFVCCQSASLSKQNLYFRLVTLQSNVQEILNDHDVQLPEDELTMLESHSRLLQAIAETLDSQIDSDVLLSGFELTLNGIETFLSSKDELYGSHLLHGSTDKPPSTTESRVSTDKNTQTSTQDSSHSTNPSVDSGEFKELIKRAKDLQEKARGAIKKLTDSHKISEALDLESNVKRLEEFIDQMEIYLSEINSIRIELYKYESKIQDQIKNSL